MPRGTDFDTVSCNAITLRPGRLPKIAWNYAIWENCHE